MYMKTVWERAGGHCLINDRLPDPFGPPGRSYASAAKVCRFLITMKLFAL